MDKKTKDFISDCLIELISSNVSIKLSNTKTVLFSENSNDYSSGFFCDNPKEFAVAVGKPQKEWFPIFIHEYNHFLQWKEQSKEWLNCDDVFFDHWLSDNTVNTRKVNKGIASLITLELDCEKRSVEMIKKFKLNIDTEHYIKCANSYVLFYNILKEKRQWYDKAPYTVDEIIDIMPNYWLNDYSKTPRLYKKLVLKHCFE